jgi:solute carrier family 25 (mitochondrial phosphate transporter), member 3
MNKHTIYIFVVVFICTISSYKNRNFKLVKNVGYQSLPMLRNDLQRSFLHTDSKYDDIPINSINNEINFDTVGKVSPISPMFNQFWNPLIFSLMLLLILSPSESDASTINIVYGHVNPNWGKYFLAGGICCTISHTVSIPFDVVKTKKQASSDLSDLSVLAAFKKIIDDDGISVLSKGFGPTLIGYFIQGSLKYGFYELFKPVIASSINADGMNSIISLMIAGIMADFIGALSLSPFEAARIRLVANPEYSSNLLDCMMKMSAVGGIANLFESFIPMLLKHLPYTAVQLSSYETITSSLYQILNENGVTDLSYWHVFVSLISASIAAVLSTLASQPGDTLMTVLNKSNPNKSMNTVIVSETAKASRTTASSIINSMASNAKDLGLRGLYSGTKARLLHVAIIVVVQLLVYDYIKQLCGLPISGYSH